MVFAFPSFGVILYRKRDMITFLGQEMLSTHICSPRNVIYSHFFAKKRYQPAGSVITFLHREIVRPITDIS